MDLLSKVYYYHGALCNVTNAATEAFDTHQKFLALRNSLKPQLEGDDELIPQAYNEIGNDHMRQKQYDLAAVYYRKSIEKYRDLKAHETVKFALPAANLGLALWSQGKFEEAADVVGTALAHREQWLGRDDRTSMK